MQAKLANVELNATHLPENVGALKPPPMETRAHIRMDQQRRKTNFYGQLSFQRRLKFGGGGATRPTSSAGWMTSRDEQSAEAPKPRSKEEEDEHSI